MSRLDRMRRDAGGYAVFALLVLLGAVLGGLAVWAVMTLAR